HAALNGVTIPARCLEGLMFVTRLVQTSVLQWGHSSKLACHPGAAHTISLIKQWFWWLSMVRDAREFVLACPVCAGFSDHCLSLRDPGPTLLWTLSQAYLRLKVTPFSKAVYFIPLPKLPSARETAAIALDHVFCIHGLSVDVISDRGPQFIS
ncbi:hypothetical protein M9458_015242, partial [Cirrhinus mrigala]